MSDLPATTNRGAAIVLGDAAIDRLRASLRGPLLGPNDAGYDPARKLWNGMIDKRPA